MAYRHGKDTVIKVGANDLSAFTTTSEFTRSADSHDVTAYGNQEHRKLGGLGDGKFTMGGTYDDGATGPRAILEPLIGTIQSITRQPAGTGAGKAQDIVDALLVSFVESSPVADTVKWEAEFELSGPVNSAVQV